MQFFIYILPSSSVSLSYFILAALMRKCLGKHSCTSSTIPITEWYLLFLATRDGPCYGRQFACLKLTIIIIMIIIYYWKSHLPISEQYNNHVTSIITKGRAHLMIFLNRSTFCYYYYSECYTSGRCSLTLLGGTPAPVYGRHAGTCVWAATSNVWSRPPTWPYTL